MIRIQLKKGTAKYAPLTTESAMVPDIDSTYQTIAYNGRRISLMDDHFCGMKQLPSLPNSGMQGMAIFKNIMVRMSAGTTHRIYSLTDDGVTSLIATFTASTNHSNSLQFAPTLQSGQVYPYLYVAELPDACSVFSIASDYTVTKAQRITIASGVVEGGNLQIGDDGYIWYSGCDRINDTWHFVKFRKVLVSEGDVTLTAEDIVDDWFTTEVRPYSVYAFQGFIIKHGKIFQLYGYGAGSNYKRGFAVYDTATHAFITEIDLTNILSLEPEDVDVWNDSVIMCTNAVNVYQFKF